MAVGPPKEEWLCPPLQSVYVGAVMRASRQTGGPDDFLLPHEFKLTK